MYLIIPKQVSTLDLTHLTITFLDLTASHFKNKCFSYSANIFVPCGTLRRMHKGDRDISGGAVWEVGVWCSMLMEAACPGRLGSLGLGHYTPKGAVGGSVPPGGGSG